MKKIGRPERERDVNEIRECKDCHQKKIVTEFVKSPGGLYRYKCKECRKNARRTGSPNTGRFQKGHDKGVRFQIGHTPWYKIKDVDNPNKGNVDRENINRYTSFLYKEWRRQVFEKDGQKCIRCLGIYRLSAHHIIPWKRNKKLRFVVDNGLTLCNKCHAIEEGFGTKIRP